MDKETISLAALAGLLHDIGKFSLRAGTGVSRIWDEEAKRDYKYKHALHSADFVEQYVPQPWQRMIKGAAGNHHRPVAKLDHIITVADRLSAGERADPVGDDSQRKVHPRQMLSIFCSLEDEQGRRAPQPAYLPLQPLRLERSVLFPREPLPEGEVWQHYADLWTGFTEEASQLQAAHQDEGNLAIYLENLLLIMQRYLWSVPSAYYRSLPDISLYDHSRMTAAVAAVLRKGNPEEKELSRLLNAPAGEGEPVAMLVAGDLSGIQEFIYTITARGAASALRGRSLYLQLLTEALARYLLRELDLPPTNLIYASGGQFYLLAAPQDAEKLSGLQQQISRLLLAKHRGDLALVLASVPLRPADFAAGRIGEMWQRLAERSQRSKLQRFGGLGQELAGLFRPMGQGGDEERLCQVCGQEDAQTSLDHRASEARGEGVRKCPLCRSFEELGDDLRQAELMVLVETTPTADADDGKGYAAILDQLGMQVRFAVQGAEGSVAQGRQGVILALKDRALAAIAPRKNWAAGRRFLVNVTPVLGADEIGELRAAGFNEQLPAAGSVKPFSVLGWQSEGINRLGVLRMDVDNLGQIFAQGLGQKASLSRVATLSLAITLYFEGWVERLAEEAAGERGRLYSIYSGGDDLFFAGAWDAVVELARQVRADLTPYAAHHPAIHASAGIALVGGKYPLYQAARDAGQAEIEAKQRQRRDEKGALHYKDAVSFLGQAVPWSQFGLTPCSAGMDDAHQLMHYLVEMVGSEGKGVPRSLISRLVNFYNQYEDAKQQARASGRDRARSGAPQVMWGPWMWRAFYALSRLGRQTGETEVIDLRDRLQDDQFRSMEWIGLAARWAELRLR